MATRRSKSQKEIYRTNAIERLRQFLKPGDTVYAVLKSRSGSGMYRHIALVTVTPMRDEYDAPVSNISSLVTDVLDWKWHDDDSVGVSGCGMDMGFYLVYSLSQALFGEDGYKCLGKGRKCPSSFHQGANYDKVSKEPHKDGYALKHKWL